MEYPKLVTGRKYRVVFQREATADTSGAQGERALEENNCIFEGNVGDWWGFIGADGIQRLLVNPNTVSYLELHIDPVLGMSQDYGVWGAGVTPSQPA